MEMPANFIEFVFWFLDYGFDIMGVLVIILLLVYFIPRRDALYLDTMKEDMEDSRETIKVLHREVVSSRVLMTEHMTEHNKTQTKLLSDCVTLMENLVSKTQQQDDHAHEFTEHMTKHDTTQTVLVKECVDIIASLAVMIGEQSRALESHIRTHSHNLIKTKNRCLTPLSDVSIRIR